MIEKEKELKDKDVKKGWLRAGYGSILAAIVMPIGIFLSSGKPASITSLSELGAVGDFFGGSTIGFLSLASIFFVIHAIRIQSQELFLQRTELALTRTELEETRKVHESSHKTMLKQQFESTFFNMLSLHNEIVNSIHYVEAGRVYDGRALFKRLRDYMNTQLKRISQQPSHNQFERLANIEQAVSETAKDFSETTSHYFKNICTLLLFLDDEKSLIDDEKFKYVEIIKSQLSPYEMVYLMYLCFRVENKTFLELSKKYNFFLSVDKDLLLRHDDYGMYCNFNVVIE
ncbi:putative phage abortive infection protein [Domibacillus enclensis]|uniref:Putative phage abortive infection protein n=1 Tax=Domibacillus enclensis TaxID=1017273 RepID=A0A1N6WI90_9BACI|nr:putative phage abortive infection protein [Domibacillus enclensis]OXS77939.1 hypothetical protein B1B05_10055 [Domibacillus enclensis]SIQ89696.1 Putative phage abortive infection protein [Domibacillus enclensis]